MAGDEREPAKVGINPEPDRDERAALEQALARLGAETAMPERTAWWRTGVRENLADASGEEPP